MAERAIQSISNLLLNHLTGYGRDWPVYVQAVCFSYNTFAHSLLGGYSPYELVFMRSPPDFLNIKFLPEDFVPITHHDYVRKLKAKFNAVASLIMDLQVRSQNKQAQERMEKSPRLTPRQ